MNATVINGDSDIAGIELNIEKIAMTIDGIIILSTEIFTPCFTVFKGDALICRLI